MTGVRVARGSLEPRVRRPVRTYERMFASRAKKGARGNDSPRGFPGRQNLALSRPSVGLLFDPADLLDLSLEGLVGRAPLALRWVAVPLRIPTVPVQVLPGLS